MNCSVDICSGFWSDWKKICKKHRSKEFRPIFGYERLKSDELDDETKIESVPLLKNIKTQIYNTSSLEKIDQFSDKYDRQPFLNLGWEIRKMRWAIDNRGKSSGLRIIFCLNSGHLLFAYIAMKNKCSDERLLEKIFMKRIKDYLNC